MGCGTSKGFRAKRALDVSVKPYKNPTDFSIHIINISYFHGLVIKDYNRDISGNPRDCEYIDCRSKSQYQSEHIKGSLNVDIKNFKSNSEDLGKSLKVLIDTKNVAFIGEDLATYQDYISDELIEVFNLFKEYRVHPKNILILNASVGEFFSSFPYLKEGNLEEKHREKYLPILLYDSADQGKISSDQVLEPKKKATKSNLDPHRLLVFMLGFSRFQQTFDLKLYQDLLGIKCIFFTFDANVQEFAKKFGLEIKQNAKGGYKSTNSEIEFYTHDLLKEKTFFSIMEKLQKEDRSMIYVHEKPNPESTITMFMNYMGKKNKFESHNLGKYIEERLPKLNTIQTVHTIQEMQVQEKSPPRENGKGQKRPTTPDQTAQSISSLKTRLEELTDLYSELVKEAKKDKQAADTINTVIIKLLENMIGNPDEEKYKQVKEDNQKLKESIFKYKSGVKLLETVGFIHKQGTNLYVNVLDEKTLKMIKVDVGLAFKKALEDQENK